MNCAPIARPDAASAENTLKRTYQPSKSFRAPPRYRAHGNYRRRKVLSAPQIGRAAQRLICTVTNPHGLAVERLRQRSDFLAPRVSKGDDRGVRVAGACASW